MPLVHHPDFEDDVREIDADQVSEYKDAGWLPVNKSDEKKAAGKAAPVK